MTPIGALDTELHGSVSGSRPRRLLRRALGRHPTGRSGAARACGCFDHGACRQVPHDPHGHEEARRGLGAGGAGHDAEGWTRPDLQARPQPTGGRDSLDRGIPPALGLTFRRVGPNRRGIETEGDVRWTQADRVIPPRARPARRRSGHRNGSSSLREPSTARRASSSKPWTRPELFQRWWAPKSFGLSLISYEADVRSGGAYRLVMGHPSSEQPMAFFGRYIEVTPHSRLVWTNDEGGEGGAVTTVTFEETDGATRVVVHELYPSKEALDDAMASGSTSGWGEQFAQLDELIVILDAKV